MVRSWRLTAAQPASLAILISSFAMLMSPLWLMPISATMKMLIIPSFLFDSPKRPCPHRAARPLLGRRGLHSVLPRTQASTSSVVAALLAADHQPLLQLSIHAILGHNPGFQTV